MTDSRRWTSIRPTEPGYYYVGQDGQVHHGDNFLVELFQRGDDLGVTFPTGLYDCRVENLSHAMFDEAFWFGPVVVEPEPKFPGYGKTMTADGFEGYSDDM